MASVDPQTHYLKLSSTSTGGRQLYPMAQKQELVIASMQRSVVHIKSTSYSVHGLRGINGSAIYVHVNVRGPELHTERREEEEKL